MSLQETYANIFERRQPFIINWNLSKNCNDVAFLKKNKQKRQNKKEISTVTVTMNKFIFFSMKLKLLLS